MSRRVAYALLVGCALVSLANLRPAARGLVASVRGAYAVPGVEAHELSVRLSVAPDAPSDARRL